MPAEKRVGEGFRPNPHHARRTHMTNNRPLPITSATPPLEETWHSRKHHHSTNN
jgi:hypothetical protein